MWQKAREICERCMRLFPDLLDGTGTSEQHEKIKELIKSNMLCQTCYESYVKTVFLSKQSLAVSPPQGIAERLVNFLRDCKKNH